MTQFPARYRLGVTAIPEWADEMEIVFTSHNGPVSVFGEVERAVPRFDNMGIPPVVTSERYVDGEALYDVVQGFLKELAESIHAPELNLDFWRDTVALTEVTTESVVPVTEERVMAAVQEGKVSAEHARRCYEEEPRRSVVVRKVSKEKEV